MLSRVNIASRLVGRRCAVPVRALAAKIIYTETDEGPALATYSLLPIVQKFAKKAGVEVEKCDISLAARILAQFPDRLAEEQRIPDTLAQLGELCKTPEANIIKLPNISASVPQLNDAITELRTKGYDVPLYTAAPTNDKEKAVAARYAKVLGSAVNPVIREGNSDRRVAAPVKSYARKNPHTLGSWSKASRTHVAHMTAGDFYGSEQSYIMPTNDTVKIEFVTPEGVRTPLRAPLPLLAGEVVDASAMSVRELCAFYEKEMTAAADEGVLFSLHLKATMMKVSDPIMFGHAVRVFFKDVFAKHAAALQTAGVNANHGLADLLEKIKALPADAAQGIRDDLEAAYAHRPWLAMVDSAKGITNLHVPSDIIIDASMPVVIRDSGKMWNREGNLEDVKCCIPDRCYALIYQEVVSFVKAHGQFDVSTMGSVANVGLMAQKAEEYGSHDKTFCLPAAGTVEVTNSAGKRLFAHSVEAGDIWRMCQTKDEAVQDWVLLALRRARATGSKTIFWLDEQRAHDRSIRSKVQAALAKEKTDGLDVSILSPVHAMRAHLEAAKAGKDSISVTGNVLRDYLTDLFPILELGTSAKMLSIVPLLKGGGLFETGAGGSAPKHVQQFLKEGHLRWDSLGEYLAIAVSLEHLAESSKPRNTSAGALGKALNAAIERLLEHRKSPGRKVNQLDNRASNFYLALYWAEFLAKEDPKAFGDVAKRLGEARATIVTELKGCQGRPEDVGGYYKFDADKASKAMRPSATFNQIIDSM